MLKEVVPLRAQITARFIAKQVAKKLRSQEQNLAEAVSEIELQTQIAGASFIKVHLADPEWVIQTSGLVTVEEGLLNEVEVEFPEHSEWFWRLCAAEGKTQEGNEPNLVLTFEDRIINFLREHRGEKTFKSTRAKAIKAMVDEVGLSGKRPKIRFVCPALNKPEQIALPKGTTKTATAKANTKASANKERGAGAGSGILIKGQAPSAEQSALVNEVMTIANTQNAGPLATEALLLACIDENDFTNKAGGGGGSSGLLQVTEETARSLNINQLNVKQCVEAFLLKGFSGNGGAISYAKEHPTAHGYEVAQAVQGSGAGAASKGAANYGQFVAEAQAIIAATGGLIAGGSNPNTTRESSAGSLKRGSTQNPSEDSWEAITRLAKEVNWFAFTDGQSLFYMDGPELAAQKPVIYIDVPKNKIIRTNAEGRKSTEYGVLQAGLLWSFDNTTFEYQATHKVKGRVQKHSKIAKPQTPSEVRFKMVCEATAFRAGQVVVFQNSGPIDGRWIITDATRNCLKDIFTQFILEPPLAPVLANATTAQATGETGSAAAAFEAASRLSEFQLPYLWGGGHEANGLTNVAKGSHGLDCSGSTCWVLHQAGMFPATQAQDSGELETFGEAGKGKEMTVWARSDHVFIEFNVKGHERAQMNTNGPQNGPRLYTIAGPNKTETYDMTPETESFVARHWPGA